ncbi:hypothetical protein [Aliarcobacter butzleri]|uniref:hypothetical protein n=1 Tax=Aliarcobacter butzleri TaxID=28197 RepID=UPI002B2563EF|nr:hypothetical protein [Aliarcobacter butzleri]
MNKQYKENEDKEVKQLNLFDNSSFEINSKIKEKLEKSTNLLDNMRVSPFLPIIKIDKKAPWFLKWEQDEYKLRRNTAWGYIEIRNRLLTQKHKEVLNAIFCIGSENKSKRIKNNRLVIFFTIYELLAKLNLSSHGKNYKSIENIITEIKDTNIIRSATNLKDMYSIIEYVGIIKDDEYEAYGIRFSEEYTKRFTEDMTIDISKKFNALLSIKGEGAGLIKAIIDHFVSHKASIERPVRYNLDNILIIINYVQEINKLKIKSTLKKYKDSLLEYGIEFFAKEELFVYSGNIDIKQFPRLIELQDKKTSKKNA